MMANIVCLEKLEVPESSKILALEKNFAKHIAINGDAYVSTRKGSAQRKSKAKTRKYAIEKENTKLNGNFEWPKFSLESIRNPIAVVGNNSKSLPYNKNLAQSGDSSGGVGILGS